ncbi:stress induced protein [Cucumis melo var. makuwa]|uniref:Stress induced protein n=2 Tax=Cucumis melo TaxID=3656 RepID=A0A5A7VG87_CUCMM|nr:stress induced protein [Cucumis melo var. makuwa]
MASSSSSSSSSSAIDGTLRSEDDRIEEGEDLRDEEVGGFSYSSCGCFFGFGSRLSRVRGGYLPLQSNRKSEEVKQQSWMMRKVKRLNEIIKAMAGRKWRSLINGIINKRRSVRFQYDPRSYALNFDEGMEEEGRRSLQPIGLGIGMNRNQI